MAPKELEKVLYFAASMITWVDDEARATDLARPAGSESSTTPPPSSTPTPGTLRQLAVAGLGHDEPTILITNDLTSPTRKVIESYARRMNIEQRLAEAIRSFGLDALAGAVPLNVDLDVVLSVLAHTVCAAASPADPATTPPPPTPCNAASSAPAARSSTTTTRSSSDSTAAPTHPCCAGQPRRTEVPCMGRTPTALRSR